MFDKKFLSLLIFLFIASVFFLSIKQYRLLAIHKETAWLTAAFTQPQNPIFDSFFITNNGAQSTEVSIRIQGSTTDTSLSDTLSSFTTKTFSLPNTTEPLTITIEHAFGDPITLTKK